MGVILLLNLECRALFLRLLIKFRDMPNPFALKLLFLDLKFLDKLLGGCNLSDSPKLTNLLSCSNIILSGLGNLSILESFLTLFLGPREFYWGSSIWLKSFTLLSRSYLEFGKCGVFNTKF